MAASRALRVRMVLRRVVSSSSREREDPIGREFFDVQRGGRAVHRRGHEAQQELEGIAIRGDGVWAGVSLSREMAREEMLALLNQVWVGMSLIGRLNERWGSYGTAGAYSGEVEQRFR